MLGCIIEIENKLQKLLYIVYNITHRMSDYCIVVTVQGKILNTDSADYTEILTQSEASV